MTSSLIKPVVDEQTVDELLRAPVAILYKHSPLCGVSARALREVTRFAETNPDMPVYQVDVVNQRALARDMASRLRIAHQSPQVIVLRKGTPMWHGSHFEVTAENLNGQLNRP